MHAGVRRSLTSLAVALALIAGGAGIAASPAQAGIGTGAVPAHELTVQVAGPGAGEVLGEGIDCGSDCSETYAAGASVVLEARPDATSAFSGWTGCDEQPEGDCLVTMQAARSVTATFGPAESDTRKLTVQKSGTGDGRVLATGISCGQDCTQRYPTGTLVRLMAYPANGSTFRGWTGCAYTASTECVVTVGSDTVVGVRFTSTRRLDTEVVSARIRSEKRTATFGFTAENARGEVSFECRMDGATFRACDSQRTFRRVRPGSHTFRVRAVDRSGPDATPAEVEFVIRR
ncbi:MAG: hypothetical protein AVDCRST_MAG47-1148 [uncultured Nocardioidaceae bacterium]|uniref:Bacterial repeat domain-containing protein n=1 Tax=uncultured Nocardioidaceae bacterium TaxID=253824 RepID=A0A6J4MVU1_9ACTN|nr:MAG: hypothetical protein AVDCRST_MAG47-1148 [uncultured Nocardioidaceae bacterium]